MINILEAIISVGVADMEVSSCTTQTSIYLSLVLLGCVPVWTHASPKPTLRYNKANTAHITRMNNGVAPGEIGNVVITGQI